MFVDGEVLATIEDGHTPVIIASKVGSKTTITIDGSAVAEIDDGEDGVTPAFSIGTVQKGDTAAATITGTAEAPVLNLTLPKGDKGNTGSAGADGHSPVVTASKSGTTTTISVDGTGIAEIEDGEDGSDGQDGQDGVSPSVSVSTITGGHRVSVTDASGTETFDVMDGERGATGQGVPPVTSADNGKVLRVINGEWAVENIPNARGVSF